MPQENQDKINKIEQFAEDKDFAMFQLYLEMLDVLKKMSSGEIPLVKGLDVVKGRITEIKGEKGDKGDRGEDGKDGISPSIEDVARLAIQMIPIPRDGKDGNDGKNGLDGKDGKTPTEQEIKNVVIPILKQLIDSAIKGRFELLNESDKFNVETIKSLQNKVASLEKELKSTTSKAESNIPPSARDLFDDIDISSQLDGTTKTFNIPATYNIISVHLSSFPNALRKTIDFTYTPTSITFTSEIDAGSSLAPGQTCVLTVVKA